MAKLLLEKTLVLKPALVALKHLFKRPVTVQYPEEKLVPSPRYRGLHFNDDAKCIGCATCARTCPNKCIELRVVRIEEKQVKDKVVKKEIKRPEIFIARCMFCGLCADACPTGSLTMTGNYELADWTRESFFYSYERLLNVKADLARAEKGVNRND